MSDLVLVTGATGFLASRCVIQLLDKGYAVRGTARDVDRAEERLRATLHDHATFDDAKLQFVKTDLNSDEGWAEACAGCKYVLHVASPFSIDQPEDEDELIRPACDGAKRVLTAAAAAGVQKTVLTSSTVAVGNGLTDNMTRTENDWHDLALPNTTAYQKSKKLAEELAWEFIKTPDAKAMKLTTICPSLILGPCIEADFGVSLILVKKIMDRAVPAMPQAGFPFVDVRDVARLHLLAMESSAADGERFIGNDGFLWIQDVSKALNEGMDEFTKKPLPTWLMPNWLCRVVGLFDKEVKAVVPSLGKSPTFSNEKAKNLLGWTPEFSLNETVVAAAESMKKYCS